MFGYVESGRRIKVFTIVDELAKEPPGILVAQSIRGVDEATLRGYGIQGRAG
jgi:hypothetical protein